MKNLSEITVTDIPGIVTVHSSKGRLEQMHCRKYYALTFCIDGQITYIQNGKEYVSDPHSVVILPKGHAYTIRGDKTGSFPVINFECKDFLCKEVTVIETENMESLLKDFAQIKNLFVFKENRAKIMSVFYDIIHKLSQGDNPGADILYPAIEYLERNYANSDITNKTLADVCNISEVYFRRLFSEKYKTTPKQYILDVRISKAKQLLTDGILKINSVSEKSGFSNPYHFCRTFKEKTGLTPSEYQKKNKIVKI